MKGVGPYNDWAASSNLSAFARPFTVNRFNSMDFHPPLADSAESVDSVPPVHFPAHSHSYGYDSSPNPVRELESTPSTKPYGYLGLEDSSRTQLPLASKEAFAYDQYPNGTKSVFESQPYYPSYISPTRNHWSSSSGFATLDGSGSSVGDYGKKSAEMFSVQSNVSGFGTLDVSGSSIGDYGKKPAEMFSDQRNVVWNHPAELNPGVNQGCQDMKDSNNRESLPMICWKKHSVTDQLDEKSCWWETIKSTPVGFSSTYAMGSPSVSLETPLKFVADSGNHHSSYTYSFEKHLRQHDQPSCVDTTSSMPKTGLVEDLNVGNIASDEVLGSNNIYDMKAVVSVPSLGTATAGCFDLSHEPTPLKNTLISEGVPNDVVDYIFKDTSGSQRQDKLTLRLSANEGFNSVEKSFESADRYNPAVDSPCWKGVPVSHFSHYEAFESMPPGGFGSIIQGSQNFLLDTDNNVKKSFEISNSNQVQKESDHQEQSFTGSSSNFAVTKITSEDWDLDGAVNEGQSQSEPSCDCGLQYLDDINETTENSVPPTKPSQKQHPAAKDHLSSHALVVDAATTIEKSAEKASTQKFSFQMLVDTMHNLSELLLFHFLNGACELKEHECNVLRKVISNLNTCALKNADQTMPAQDCLLTQAEPSRFSGETCELQKNASFERPRITTVGPESSRVELQEENNLYFRSGKPHVSFSDSFASRVDAEIKEDNMTKALKGILSENFHDEEVAEPQTILYKNLWLEAEAALCSMYYKARYNQMKIDMKFAFNKKDNALGMEEKSKHTVAPSFSTSDSSAAKMQSGPTPDSLNATNLKDISSLKFSTNQNKPDAWTREGKGSHELDISIQNSTVSKTNKEAVDDEASVMARFNVLKTRFDKSYINTILEELSSKEDNTCNGRDHQTPVDSPNLAENKGNDYESSVMARFHILKSRAEDSSFISSEGKPLDGSKGIDFSVTNDASKGENLDGFLNLSSYTTIDKSSTKEFNVDLEDDIEEIPLSRTYRFGNYGNQLPTYYSDGLSSEWEHIEKIL